MEKQFKQQCHSSAVQKLKEDFGSSLALLFPKTNGDPGESHMQTPIERRLENLYSTMLAI